MRDIERRAARAVNTLRPQMTTRGRAPATTNDVEYVTVNCDDGSVVFLSQERADAVEQLRANDNVTDLQIPLLEGIATNVIVDVEDLR
ncbi:hypothetical protein [Halomarina rubra]|uniref:Uncharacterized protein n=1 Tax=Halomarina rubra TaxID=2071873 RepID=A0ABD6AS64_9EURY|nr:hypothetical protein [Halomarina rubra]